MQTLATYIIGLTVMALASQTTIWIFNTGVDQILATFPK